MPEWSIGTVSKTVVPVRVPRVRIPLFPPIDTKEKPVNYYRLLFYIGNKALSSSHISEYLIFKKTNSKRYYSHKDLLIKEHFKITLKMFPNLKIFD
jgi:hypothetical protein